MAGIHRIGLGAVLGFAFLAGCGGQQSNPIAQATSEWLDAILKGDKQRASMRMTPQARQQIIANDLEFSPPGGVETTTFEIGEVRTPAQDQAIVQCVLSFTAAGKQRTEELCCILRLVENEWQVAGIAYGIAPDKPWMLTNFETGQDVPIPRQAMTGDSQPATGTSDGFNRPSPPRMAQEPSAMQPR